MDRFGHSDKRAGFYQIYNDIQGLGFEMGENLDGFEINRPNLSDFRTFDENQE